MIVKKLNCVTNVTCYKIKIQKKYFSKFKFPDNRTQLEIHVPSHISTSVDLKNYLIKLDAFEQLADCLESYKKTYFDKFKNDKDQDLSIIVSFSVEQIADLNRLYKLLQVSPVEVMNINSGLPILLLPNMSTPLDFEKHFEDYFEEIALKLRMYKKNVIPEFNPIEDQICIYFSYHFHDRVLQYKLADEKALDDNISSKKSYSHQIKDTSVGYFPTIIIELSSDPYTALGLKNHFKKNNLFEIIAEKLPILKQELDNAFKDSKKIICIDFSFKIHNVVDFKKVNFIEESLPKENLNKTIILRSILNTSVDVETHFEFFFENYFEEIVLKLELYKEKISNEFNSSEDMIYIHFSYNFDRTIWANNEDKKDKDFLEPDIFIDSKGNIRQYRFFY